jgi:tetraacyldisaccharide 4'-kinase
MLVSLYAICSFSDKMGRIWKSIFFSLSLKIGSVILAPFQEMRKFLLTLASWLYKMAILFRHQLFDWGILKSRKFSIPIICIGNITVGGTGKTPLAELIVGHMLHLHRVALLSRGYGRATKGYREVQPTDSYREVGDEPLQIKRKFPEVLVVVCAKRVEAIERIQTEHPDIDLIVMDDGFQHRYVDAKVNIVVIDSTRPPYEDAMLPLGRLRDVPEQLHRAQYFIVTKCSRDMSAIDRRLYRRRLLEQAYQSLYFTRMETFRPQPVFSEGMAGGFDVGSEVIVMSGIGNPQVFERSVENDYRVVDTLRFEDHHVYRVRDMRTLSQLIERHPQAQVLTTEKDAVKLCGKAKVPMEVRRRLYFQPINIVFNDYSAIDFLQNLEKDVRTDS